MEKKLKKKGKIERRKERKKESDLCKKWKPGKEKKTNLTKSLIDGPLYLYGQRWET